MTKDARDEIMGRTKAAVAYANATNDEDTDLRAFMAIFHPEHDKDAVREMARDASENGKKRRS